MYILPLLFSPFLHSHPPAPPIAPLPTPSTIQTQLTLFASNQISPTRPLPLPLYLALLLCVQRLSSSFTNNTQETPLLTIDLPPSLSPRVLNALRADPRTVDLRGLERGWYEGAGRVLEVLEDEEGDVGGVVGEVSLESFFGGGVWGEGVKG